MFLLQLVAFSPRLLPLKSHF